jgi:hypothetical protein
MRLNMTSTGYYKGLDSTIATFSNGLKSFDWMAGLNFIIKGGK